ncbi:MAG: bifunctional precorrin-2 dehydrogenase/sirohydrochlorin ferrochelatase [Deltaproteobacteria bacterium]|nr:bifunctional precorrin-2 dehydrogenase/sirohydrochlorin ferrochelatase [Deltaproteobacteria bacterium]
MPRRYYPIFLDIKGFPCVVIGGGAVAEQKVRQVLAAGAKVRVISPRLTPTLKEWARGKRFEYKKRLYRRGDLRGARLTFAATNHPRTNARILKEARSQKVWLNAVDDPKNCDFVVPSMVHRGNLTVAISTNGLSPALSKKIRKDLENQFGPEYEIFLQLLGTLRKRPLPEGADGKIRSERLSALVNSSALHWIQKKDGISMNRLLRKLFGKEITLENLGIELKL